MIILPIKNLKYVVDRSRALGFIMITIPCILVILWIFKINGWLTVDILDFSQFIFGSQSMNLISIMFLLATTIPIIFPFVSFLYSINLIYQFGSKYTNFLLLHIFLLLFYIFLYYGIDLLTYNLLTRSLFPIFIFYAYIRIGIYLVTSKNKVISDFNKTFNI